MLQKKSKASSMTRVLQCKVSSRVSTHNVIKASFTLDRTDSFVVDRLLDLAVYTISWRSNLMWTPLSLPSIYRGPVSHEAGKIAEFGGQCERRYTKLYANIMLTRQKCCLNARQICRRRQFCRVVLMRPTLVSVRPNLNRRVRWAWRACCRRPLPPTCGALCCRRCRSDTRYRFYRPPTTGHDPLTSHLSPLTPSPLTHTSSAFCYNLWRSNAYVTVNHLEVDRGPFHYIGSKSFLIK